MDRDPAEGPGRRARRSAPSTVTTGSAIRPWPRSWPTPSLPAIRWPRSAGSPCIGPHLATIEQILADDKEAPPKQRHTARRIFERLRDEYGYTGCYSQVQTAVKRAKQYSKEAFVPLSHPPGHAQFDFGEAVVEIAGERTKAHLGVITLPYSDTYFLSAYPRECTETFQAAHVAGFEFFGGVPVRISYDNTTIAVSKVMGTERELTRGFLTLESHHLFDHHFCRVGRGNEKGHVENHVGYSRRNLLVPVPSFASWAALNEYLAACLLCRPVPPGPGQGGHQGRAPGRRPGRHVGAAGRGLRAPPRGPGTCQLAFVGPIRPQRLLGADAPMPITR